MIGRAVIAGYSTTVVVAMLAGCSGGHRSTDDATGPAPTTDPAVGTTTSAEAPTGRVLVAGEDQHISGPVRCEVIDDTATITVGTRMPMAAVNLSSFDHPTVSEVQVQGEDYLLGSPMSGASVTKDGKTYHVTATAQRVIVSTVQVEKVPVDITATCP